jgi:hypothetical protein
MAFESGQELAALNFPGPRGLVLGGGQHPLAVWTKDRAIDHVVVLERGQELAGDNGYAGLRLPEPRGRVSSDGEHSPEQQSIATLRKRPRPCEDFAP